VEPRRSTGSLSAAHGTRTERVDPSLHALFR
jgi:hypothetical protein